MRIKPLALIISTFMLSSNALANKAIIFPDEFNSNLPISHTEANSLSEQPVFDLATDDLGNKIRTITLSNRIDVELVEELERIGLEQGFSVSAQDAMYKWTEDNMWLSREGNKVFRPQKTIQGSEKDRFFRFITGMDSQSPLASIEGHHSLGINHSQGLPQSELNLANIYATNNNAELIKTFSIIDGGNMLVGKREDGTPYVLVGRDAVLQTALRHMSSDDERFEVEKLKLENGDGFKLAIVKMRRVNIYFQQNSDPEIDRLLLKSANLLPTGLPHAEQIEYAKLIRAKSNIVSLSNDEKNKASSQMDLSQVKTQILDRYVELNGGSLPDEFNLDFQLKNDFERLAAAVSKTSEFDLTQIDKKLTTLTKNNVEIDHLAKMLKAGNYIRKNLTQEEAHLQGRRFKAMMEIVQDKMAEELGVTRKNLVVITQPGFHIDMELRPLENGKVLVNDYEFSQQLVQYIINEDTSITHTEREDLRKTLTQLKELAVKYAPIYQTIRKQLSDAGLTQVKTAGAFNVGARPVNWMNGIMGTGSSKFYVTNASSIPSLNKAFSDWLKHIVPGISVYFVGNEISTSFTSQNTQSKYGYSLNQAEDLLEAQGGLDCITVHFE